MAGMEDEIARLTAERDLAREECGVWKYKAEGYREEMYRYLKDLMELKNS